MEEDLKKETVNSEESRQSETKQEVAGASEELTALQERLKKAEEDRDKYKERVLSFSKKERTLSERKEEKEEEEAPDWDEASKKFQAQTLSEAEKRARIAAQSYVEENNEKAAISKFLTEHPELGGDEEWKEILSNYHPKHGKGTVDSILTDLNRARVVMLHDHGELDKLSKEAEERGKRKGAAETYHASAHTSSGSASGSTSDQGSDGVSKGAKAIAQAFGIDPKKLGS